MLATLCIEQEAAAILKQLTATTCLTLIGKAKQCITNSYSRRPWGPGYVWLQPILHGKGAQSHESSQCYSFTHKTQALMHCQPFCASPHAALLMCNRCWGATEPNALRKQVTVGCKVMWFMFPKNRKCQSDLLHQVQLPSLNGELQDCAQQ